MGNYVSNNAVYLSAKRVLMRYNVESRAFKELEKQSHKPIAAPKHEAEFIDYHKSMKENTEYLSKTTAVDKNLDQKLKKVYVTSKGLTENLKTDKPLPISRSTESFPLGYKESNKVAPGRVSLLQAINFITKHQQQPDVWTIEKIAEENKIKPDVAKDIIDHFRPFDVHMSKDIQEKDMPQIEANLKLLGGKTADN